jgi:hypothetical protein
MKNTSRWPIVFVVGLALIIPAVALARTTHWSGSVNYGVTDKYGDRGVYDINFNVSRGKVTYWFLGYACRPRVQGSANFPTRARIRKGKFRLDYTEPTGTNPVSHSPYDDPGFHVIIKGKFSGRKASGTIDVLNDPSLGGKCSFGPKPWHAHKTG